MRYPRRSYSRVIGSNLPKFTIPDAQWLEIIPKLPPNIREEPAAARRWLERFGQYYRAGLLPENPRSRAKSWHRIAKLADRLAQEIQDVRRTEDYLQWLVLVCADLNEEALDNADQNELLAMGSRGRRIPNNEMVYGAVLDFWILNGGKLSRSRTLKKPTGPLVAFLEATLVALMEDEAPKLEGIYKIIEREMQRRNVVITGPNLE